MSKAEIVKQLIDFSKTFTDRKDVIFVDNKEANDFVVRNGLAFVLGVLKLRISFAENWGI